jgi:hypothetical protein
MSFLSSYEFLYTQYINIFTYSSTVFTSVEVEIAIEELKRYKSLGIDQILAELIEAGDDNYVLISTNLLILFGIRKNCHSSQRNLLYTYL